jgi:hypothetical protein
MATEAIPLPVDQPHGGLPGASKSGFQKRIDKLTREKYGLLAENEQLRQANNELTLALAKAERLIQKYKAALVKR